MNTPISLPPVSLIMPFHNEGVLAHKSLLGMQRMRDYLTAQKGSMDLICTLDCADEQTANIVKNYISKFGSANDQVIEVECGSLSASRNIGLDAAKTEYAGTLDGDDFLSANWLYAALEQQLQSPSTVLSIPKYIVSFGERICIAQTIPSRSIPQVQMVNTHYWVAPSFSRISTYRNIPYNELVGKGSKFAFEDWDFNLRCVAAGIAIEPTEETYQFYRTKKASMLTEHISFGSFTPAFPFFEQLTM